MLQLSHITKNYGNFRAVDDLSFTAEEGKIIGLIGPNGAGKSTTIRLIMNILQPDSGEILFYGKPYSEEYSDRTGYLPEERGLYKKQKVSDMLRYLASLKGMKKEDIETQIDFWLKKFGLEKWKNEKIDSLSKGMSQKVQFISAIMHSPEIVFLDEPFSGLDPVSCDQLLEVIRDMKTKGRIILFSTHVMETAEIICDHIIMLNHGKKILDGTVQEIRRKFGSNTLTIVCTGEHSFLNSIGAVADITERGHELNISFKQGTDVNALVTEIVDKAYQNNCSISSLKINEPSLHSVFVSIAAENNDTNQ